jgi:hypothetical protein
VHGQPRFYIDGTYAQSAGGTVGAQISVWVWDGMTARPQIARAYALMVDQSASTRVEGDLLMVQQKKFFRTFFSCGMCEPRGGEFGPELDAADELFYGGIHHKSAADVTAPSLIKSPEKIRRWAQKNP